MLLIAVAPLFAADVTLATASALSYAFERMCGNTSLLNPSALTEIFCRATFRVAAEHVLCCTKVQFKIFDSDVMLSATNLEIAHSANIVILP